MKLHSIHMFALTVLFVAAFPASYAHADSINLQSAGTFALLAGSAVTNTGPTIIDGNLGVSPGSSVTGFGLGFGSGTMYISDAVAAQAQRDLSAAYATAAGLTGGVDLSGQDLGGLTLTPGVYKFTSSAQLTGPLTIDAGGNPNAQFVFQIGSALTSASGSSVILTDGAQGNNLFWQVGSSATLGTTTAFAGNVLAFDSITLDTGATIGCGSALAETGAVTLDDNTISACAADVPAAVPEPAAFILFATGLFALAAFYMCAESMALQAGPSQRKKKDTK